jgi:hypothetical protein
MSDKYPYNATGSEGDQDRISLRPLVAVVRRHNRSLLRGLAGLAVLLAGLVLALYLILPSERYGAMTFRVLFPGAEGGTYPNGSRFSGADVVAPPVLTAVYRANDLSRYVQFDDFKNAMFVLQSNAQLEFLSDEYAAKLSDTKLSPVDRGRIEDEFKKKRESLTNAEYALNFRRRQRFKTLPDTLVAQLFDATLAEWARQARDQKGALKYDLAVFSRNILQPDLVAREDYIIAVDVLRTKINKILVNIDQISHIPGAATMRSGKSRLSLAEIRLNLQDLLRFDIEPAITLITSGKLTRDPQRARVYVEDQLRQINLSHEASAQRVKAIQDPLRDYVTMSMATRSATGPPRTDATQAPLNTPALIPQLGESFLQQVIDMSTQNNDAKYRQGLTDRVIEEGLQVASDERERAYYQDLSRALGAWTKSPESPEGKDLIARLEKAYQVVGNSLDDTVAIYDDLSAQNLNPSTQLYQITRPFSQHTERVISLSRLVALAAIAYVLGAAGLILAYVLWDQYYGAVAAPDPTVDDSLGA